ncbi:hypothetical protein [Pseudarthrobacter phenanthrenivorans]|uniref:hypothetical protein n=1 Tax=Pseudarthrobacter phenanthrenivorans TaxID=361575 RepID=UPI0002D963DA|nr:hypothetical protein [Pseudarthrobacter phenanthrenivorans]
MSENPLKDQPSGHDDERVHTEMPAEGDPDADPAGLRVHTQDPAEGADPGSAGTEGTDD